MQFAVEVLDLVKQTLPVASAAAQTAVKVVQSRSALRDGADDGGSTPQTAEYSDIGLLHYATVETEHPYKQASVSHFKVGQPGPLSGNCRGVFELLSIFLSNFSTHSSCSGLPVCNLIILFL